jgi:AhpD family alkylhydroperoxidase
MDEKTSLLICLGASAAANCIPCFEHYHKKASAAGLTSEEILEAVELANKVQSGAHLAMRNSIKNFMGQELPPLSVASVHPRSPAAFNDRTVSK